MLPPAKINAHPAIGKIADQLRWLPSAPASGVLRYGSFLLTRMVFLFDKQAAAMAAMRIQPGTLAP
jgi:hypothetical protein